MSSLRVKVQGVRAIQKAFRELEPNLARKVIRQSLRKASNVVMAAEKALAPVDTGAARKTLRVRTAKLRGGRGAKTKQIAFAVLIGGAKSPEWYISLQELGWTGPSGRHVPGKHFGLRAMQAKEPSVQQQIARDILMGIEKEAKA